MVIVADAAILGLDAFFSQHKLTKIPAEAINQRTLRQADILLIRSVTRVDEQLLRNTKVQCVATLTSGTDHLDLPWLAQAGIGWFSAHGANAHTVVEYVLCCIAALRARQMLCTAGGRAGVIGAGAVGSQVAQALQQLGFTVLINDPVRDERQPNFISTPLTAFVDLDIICVHAELTYSGNHPSYHLLDNDFLSRQRSGCVLINAARGAVIATEALLKNTHLCLCLDVWEYEPIISLPLLQQTLIATPHIAGYSVQAKHRAVKLVYQQLQERFNWPAQSGMQIDSHKPRCTQAVELDAAGEWQRCAIQALDVFAATAQMRHELLSNPVHVGESFKALRRLFVERNEFMRLVP